VLVDDKLGREQGHALFKLSCELKTRLLIVPNIDLSLCLQVDHYDMRGISAPFVESCSLSIRTIIGMHARTASIEADEIKLVVTTDLILDILRLDEMLDYVDDSVDVVDDRNVELDGNTSNTVTIASPTYGSSLVVANYTGSRVSLWRLDTMEETVIGNQESKEVCDSAADASLLIWIIDHGKILCPTTQPSFWHSGTEGLVTIQSKIVRDRAQSIITLYGLFTFYNQLDDTISVRTIGHDKVRQVSSGSTYDLPATTTTTDQIELTTGDASSVMIGPLGELPTHSRLGIGTRCWSLYVRTQRVRASTIDVDGSKSEDSCWVDAVSIEVAAAVTVVNTSPYTMSLSYTMDGATTTRIIDADGGRSEMMGSTDFKNRMMEVSVSITMDGLTYTSPDKGFRNNDHVMLSCADINRAVLRLELARGDCGLTQAHVIEFMAQYCLVNSCGRQLELYSHGNSSEVDSLFVRSNHKDKALSSCSDMSVMTWMQREDDIMIMPPLSKNELVKFAIGGGTSKAISLVGNMFVEGMLEVEDTVGPIAQLAVTVKDHDTAASMAASHWRGRRGLPAVPVTKFVRVLPGCVLANNLDLDLELASGERQMTTVKAHGAVRLDFRMRAGDQKSPRLLKIRRVGSEHWSGAFSVQDVHTFSMWVETDFLARVCIQSENGVLFISMTVEPDPPLFQLRNTTNRPVQVRQCGCGHPQNTLARVCAAGDCVPLGVDDPTKPCKFSLSFQDLRGGGMQRTVECSPEGFSSEKTDHICVETDMKRGTRTITLRGVADEHVAAPLVTDATPPFKILVQLASGVDVSLVAVDRELVLVGLGPVFLELQLRRTQILAELRVNSIQVDDMQQKTECPVLLGCYSGDSSADGGNVAPAALHVACVARRGVWADKVILLDTMAVSFQKLNLELDFSLVSGLKEFWQRLKLGRQVDKESRQLRRLSHEKEQSNKRVIYMAHCQIHPLVLALTVRNLKNIDDVDINNAPVQLHGLAFQNMYGAIVEVLKRIGVSLGKVAKGQVLIICGSLGILGNPVRFLTKLGTGWESFVHEVRNDCLL
jgi:hypothetical protein